MSPEYKQKLKALKSNGHGSFFQQIYVSVQKEHAEVIEKEMRLQKISENGDVVQFLWERKSRNLRDDEEIVFELDFYSGIPLGTWKIDWDRSIY